MTKILNRKFFDRPTLTVAKELLGKFLVVKIGKNKVEGMITEVEAYVGTKDLASHASRGRTKRTETMFGRPGHAYVYMIYGMYFCLNFVTERKDYPAAILIRGVSLKTENDKPKILLNGPGKVGRYFQINKTLNDADITTSNELWVEDRGVKIKSSQIKRAPRIGIDYAKEYKEKPWRLYVNPVKSGPTGTTQ